uniref:Uncharacterized protein n=1 Tax=Rhizophora mucronata TaxID=61149 RepID=A0A2P2IN69_RHIMU
MTSDFGDLTSLSGMASISRRVLLLQTSPMSTDLWANFHLSEILFLASLLTYDSVVWEEGLR